MSVQKQIDRLTVHRAAEWLEVLRTERREEYGGFIQWINESPRHLDEFLKLVALSRAARNVIRDPSFDTAALLASAGREPPELPSVKDGLHVTLAPNRRRPRWRVAAAASLAALAIATLWTTGALSPWKGLETGTGEQSTVHLDDGSIVILNARSKIQVRLGADARDIRLMDGEALFRVAHDAQRPFKVHTREAIVQAVGTEFDVTARLDGTRVAVLEGKVQVSVNDDRAPLAAGEAAHVSSQGGIELKSPQEAANATAWRQRRLIFESTPLEQAAVEFNRYHRSLQLRVEGIAPGSHHYSGAFDADDLTSFTDLLSRERDLIVEKRTNEIVIRPRPGTL